MWYEVSAPTWPARALYDTSCGFPTWEERVVEHLPPRPRLESKLDAALAHRLTVVVADAGFGMSPLRPIALEDGAEGEHGGWTHRVRRVDTGAGPTWELHRLRDAGWELMHTPTSFRCARWTWVSPRGARRSRPARCGSGSGR